MPSQTRRFTSFVDSGEGGTLAWANPSNVGASDNAYATVSAPGSGFPLSNWLHCTVAGPTPFAIPSGATNISAVLEIEGHGSAALKVSYEALFLLDGVRQVDFTTQGLFATSDEIKVHPAVTDALLTPENLNDPANGIAFQFQFYSLDGLSTVIASLDDMVLTISYDTTSGVIVPVRSLKSNLYQSGSRESVLIQ